MKKYSLLALLLGGFVSAGVEANEPIADRDVFEKEYVKCIEKNFKDECFKNIFSGRLDYRSNQQALVTGAEGFFINWMAKESIYKVHVANKVEKAGVFESRSYLIERSDGVLAGFFVGFRNVKGSWYVYDIQGGYSDLFIRTLIDMPMVNPADGK